MTSMSIISRQAAKAQGLRFYIGKPCCRGHMGGLRYVADLSCAECRQVKQATAPERAKRRAYQKARRRRTAIAIEALAKLGVTI